MAVRLLCAVCWESAPPGCLFYIHWKRNGTNILHTITWSPPDTILLYFPSTPTYLPWTAHYLMPHSPIGSGQDYSTTLARYILHFASSHTPQSTTSPWRWNRYRVPKRRPTTNWRRGNNQKNIFNIQITAKVWNQERSTSVSIFNFLLDHIWSLVETNYKIWGNLLSQSGCGYHIRICRASADSADCC